MTLMQEHIGDARPFCILTNISHSSKCSHLTLGVFVHFYARKQLLLSARLSHRNSVRPSVGLSVRQTGGSIKNGAS